MSIGKGSSYGDEIVFRNSVASPITAADGAVPTDPEEGLDPQGSQRALLIFKDTLGGSFSFLVYRWSDEFQEFIPAKPILRTSGSDIFTIDVGGNLPVWIQFTEVNGASISVAYKLYNMDS